MYGKNFFRQRPGAPIPAKANNRLAEHAEGVARSRVGTGGQGFTVNGALLVRVPVYSRVQVRGAYTPGGGVPHGSGTDPTITPGSATCQFCTFDGTSWALSSPAESHTVFNSHPTQDVGANKLVYVVLIDGYWFVDWERC